MANLCLKSLLRAECYFSSDNPQDPCLGSSPDIDFDLSSLFPDMFSVEETLPSVDASSFRPLSHDDVLGLLHACRKSRDSVQAARLYSHMRENGLDRNSILANSLVSTLAEVGSLSHARDVFDRLPFRSKDAWNSLLAGYIACGQSHNALYLYSDIQESPQWDPILPSATATLLKACSEIKDLKTGCQIHANILQTGLLEKYTFVGNALIGMYTKCGSIAKAQEVFSSLPVRDVVSWNTLMAGYVNNGLGNEALQCFEQMRQDGVSPNPVSFLCALKACGIAGAIDKCEEIHNTISRMGLLKENFQLGSLLLDVYAKLGLLEKAHSVFDMLPVRDVVSWTSLIGGYAEHGYGEEALHCLELMKCDDISPNAATFVCSLKACSTIGASIKGREIHAEISREGLLRGNIRVGNALVDMYAKCGLLSEAQAVINRMPSRNIITWTALIAGYAQIGEFRYVCVILNEMIETGIHPNVVTFLVLLSACSHSGFVAKGQTYFEFMCRGFGIIPTIEHYNCMVDLLGRAGQLEMAVAMIEKMPLEPDIRLWHTLLGACRMVGNVEISRKAFKSAIVLDEKDDAAYICMYNIYANAGMQESAKMVKALRIEKEAWCKSGSSNPLLASD